MRSSPPKSFTGTHPCRVPNPSRPSPQGWESTEGAEAFRPLNTRRTRRRGLQPRAFRPATRHGVSRAAKPPLQQAAPAPATLPIPLPTVILSEGCPIGTTAVERSAVAFPPTRRPRQYLRAHIPRNPLIPSAKFSPPLCRSFPPSVAQWKCERNILALNSPAIGDRLFPIPLLRRGIPGSPPTGLRRREGTPPPPLFFIFLFHSFLAD